MAAEPCPFWLQRIGGGEARFAAVAVVDVARPRAVKIHAADVGVGRATDAERAVGLAAQRGRVAIHHVHDGTRFLVVVREVEDYVARRLPVRGERIVVEILVAKHAGTDGVAVERIEFRVVDAEYGRGDAARAVGGADGGGVVTPSEERPDGVEDRVIVFNVNVAVSGAADGAIATDHADQLLRGGGHRVVGHERDGAHAEGLAVVIPREHLFGIAEGADDGVDVAADLAHRGERDGAEWAPRDGAEDAALVLKIKGAPPAVFLVEGGDGDREFVFDDDLVGIDLEALTGPGAEAVTDGGGVAVGLGDFGGLVEEASWRTDAEEDAIGPAGVFETADAIRVRRRDAREVIHADTREESADLDTGEEGVAADDAVLLGRRALRIGVHLGVHGELEEMGDVRDREVVEKLLRENGDRAGGVAELRVEAAAGEGVFGGVAEVVMGGDGERAELDDVRGGVGLWCGGGRGSLGDQRRM